MSWYVFVKNTSHNEIATLCLLLHINDTLVAPLSMGSFIVRLKTKMFPNLHAISCLSC